MQRKRKDIKADNHPQNTLETNLQDFMDENLPQCHAKF